MTPPKQPRITVAGWLGVWGERSGADMDPAQEVASKCIFLAL